MSEAASLAAVQAQRAEGKLVTTNFVVANPDRDRHITPMNLPSAGFFIAAGLLVSAFGGNAPVQTEPAPASKTSFNLFNPTPRELMRQMSTDRPDKTESPYTVDTGHVQVEMDLALFTYDRHNTERTDIRVESWSFGTVNLKLGLLNNVDFQVVVDPWNTTRTVENPGNLKSRADGFGDIALRTKFNLWGNDSGKTAFGLMPFVKIPTNENDLGNDAVEGGVIVPLAVQFPGGWNMGLMTEIDFAEDSDEDAYHAGWVNSVTFSHDLTEQLGAYLEFYSEVSSEPHSPWIGTFDVGLTYGIGENIQLDAGVNLGLTRSADDLSTFVGLSWRF